MMRTMGPLVDDAREQPMEEGQTGKQKEIVAEAIRRLGPS